MNKTIAWVLFAAAIGGGLGAFYYFWKNPAEPPDSAEVATVTEGSAELDSGDRIRHPIPGEQTNEQAEAQALPDLDQSDEPLKSALGELYGESNVARYLVPDRLVRRIVITVDNLSRDKLAVQMRPVKPLGGSTAVIGDADADETVTLSSENYARYKPIVELVRATDVDRLAALYFRLYPLFQQAFEELGYPGKYFNDRLVDSLDHLLETPAISGEIKLVRPRVFYEYADPELERRSAGQKLLIRMGPENAALVKEKLRELRQTVAKRAE